MRYLLNMLYLLAIMLGLPFIIYKVITTGKYRRGVGQRMGKLRFKPDGRPLIWLHAVSVGELQAAQGIVDGLEERYPDHQIAISHTTRTGEEVAEKLYPKLSRFYFPMDFSWVIQKLFRKLKPKLVILMELELWPNFLMIAKKRGVPILMANGRISEKSGLGYGRNAWFFAKPFGGITRALMQNSEYLHRFQDLYRKMGLDLESISIGGNVKFENLPQGRDEAKRAEYRKLFGFKEDEQVLICGSTHPGEHEIIAALLHKLSDHLRVILVPRHPERWTEVRKLFKNEGLALVERSALSLESRNQDEKATILLDTMGELSGVYHAADFAFIGGSLIPHGGQNMLEACACGLPTLFGPNTANFRAIVRELLVSDAAIEVSGADDLERVLMLLLATPERVSELGINAQKVIDAGRGGLAKHMAAIDEMLSQEPS